MNYRTRGIFSLVYSIKFSLASDLFALVDGYSF